MKELMNWSNFNMRENKKKLRNYGVFEKQLTSNGTNSLKPLKTNISVS